MKDSDKSFRVTIYVLSESDERVTRTRPVSIHGRGAYVLVVPANSDSARILNLQYNDGGLVAYLPLKTTKKRLGEFYTPTGIQLVSDFRNSLRRAVLKQVRAFSPGGNLPNENSTAGSTVTCKKICYQTPILPDSRIGVGGNGRFVNNRRWGCYDI